MYRSMIYLTRRLMCNGDVQVRLSALAGPVGAGIWDRSELSLPEQYVGAVHGGKARVERVADVREQRRTEALVEAVC